MNNHIPRSIQWELSIRDPQANPHARLPVFQDYTVSADQVAGINKIFLDLLNKARNTEE